MSKRKTKSAVGSGELVRRLAVGDKGPWGEIAAMGTHRGERFYMMVDFDKTLAPASGYAYAVVRLTDLRITRCADKDALYDAVSAYIKRGVGYIPLRWHVGAQTWVALEARE